MPALAVALIAVLVGLVASPASGQTETGFLTTVNASTETIDVYIDDQLAGVRLEPGETGREFSLPTGPHTIDIYPTGATARAANLLARTDAEVLANAGASVVAWGSDEPDIGLHAFPNPGQPEPGTSCVVLRHLADADPTQLLIDGEPAGDPVGEGSSTRSILIEPGVVDLGLDGIESTPARAELRSGSCVAVHAVGGQDVIVNLVLQPLIPHGDTELETPAPVGPAGIEIVNGLRGLAVDFQFDQPEVGVGTIPLGPLTADTFTSTLEKLEGRFVDPNGLDLAAVGVAVTPGNDLTVTLHPDANGEPTVTVFDNAGPALDDRTACVAVRILATTSEPVGVALQNGPAQIDMGPGDTTGALGIDPGPTTLTVGPIGSELTLARDLEGGTCLHLYLVDTADGLQLVDISDLEAGLTTDREPEVAGQQVTLPVTGWGETALPLVLFALGVIIFGIGLIGRSREP